jgi:DNA-3-methyladenine glycosylase
MRLRRGRETDLTTGPARLCEAMAIDRRLDGWDLTRRSRLWIGGDGSESAESTGVGVSGRIGVREPKELPLRFYLRYNPFVSGPKRLRD